MDTELIVFGTGHGMAIRCFNTCFALRNENEHFLVDGGGGNEILSRFMDAGLTCQNTPTMFITHGHTDHILGSIWVIRYYCEEMLENRYKGGFTIYAHKDLVDMLDLFLNMLFPPYLRAFIGNGVFIKVVESGDVAHINQMSVTFFDIGSTKLKQFGFKAVLPNGQTLTCLGDETYKDSSKPYTQDADWMMSEAFCLYRDKDIFHPYEKHHCTALDAGKQAEELGVKNLIIYHTEDSDLAHRKEEYTKEAKTHYHGRVFVPDDMDRFYLK